MTTLSIRNLSIDYIGPRSDFHAVKDVSFDVGRGEFFGLAGESGCGKSTIAFAISRLHRPPALIRKGSQILIEGRDVMALDARALRDFRWREVAMVFQSAMNSLNPVLTIVDQFYDVLKTHAGMSRDQARARAAELLALVDIPAHRLDAYPHQCSGGMRQRIVIAICLSLNPKLLIMDEPTTALDVVVQHEILQRINKLRKDLGFSVLFITHDLGLMVQVSDRIGIMLEGELVEVGEAQSIYRNPQHDYTKRLWAAMPRLHGARLQEAGR
ncbi:ABC transporter ATP-binding protein [Ketogulonicigenium vulgare]|uniref:ABC transporter ATP-binding protein n=1 Tax=Ketogulonicigenium vulgare TaxID=92945 RepID=UPI0001E67952|nr:ABC transporter ATP-binding protein [Ketogulonicigenium vulgare]ADO41456.1 putative ATP-binding component of ABC transporter [Ketogulonicigenium vulgare Y25]ALJ79936.1 sugar ABC transporter ATP-binding protein [Ketogulonicigenium vulgare]ANW32830.1 sugar ABC transporter ATP-binding protein [Ketogulonicigenium vulgare]AOZ53391.1 ABC transporter ATP-binding protein [Ketogulonicigenium vulgare]